MKSLKLPMIFQDELAECGHACVAMISNFWGHELDLFSLRKIHAPSARGITLKTIHHLFEKLSFRTRALKVSLSELNLVKCPAILHWNMNHFVVLKKVNKHSIIIHDPAYGIRKCSMDEVSEAFTGIVLEVERSTDFQTIKTQGTLKLTDFSKTATGVNKVLVLLVFLSLSIEVLSLINPLFMQFVTDDVLSSSSVGNLYVIASAFAILGLFHVFVEYIRGSMVIYLTNNLTEKFSSNVVKHILKLPLDFFEKRSKGDLQSKFQSIDQIQKKISTDFINTVLDGFMIFINVFVMFIYSARLTMMVLASLAIYIGIRCSSYYFLEKNTEKSIQQHAKSAAYFLETLEGIMSIKSFSKENTRFSIWKNSYVNSLNADVHISRLNLIYTIASQLLITLELIIVVCFGANLVLSNQFSLGMLIAFLSYRLLLINKASSFIQNIFDYKLISIQLNRLSDILFQKPEIISSGQGVLESMQGKLVLSNVYFKYNPMDNYILNDVNLEIKAGEKVAIIGPSGCGKSTLLKVMMGLLETTQGNIYIDDRLINEFGLKNYREVTASVMQEDILLSGSILDNIVFFDEELDLAYVYEVSKLAYIHDFISQLPMGYESRVGDMGSMLSGGQKQRILLARALYKRPKILFLDEATSHLDDENERNINQSLKALNITQIVVAHRKETIQMADRVISL